jgi:hypothetical protein
MDCELVVAIVLLAVFVLIVVKAVGGYGSSSAAKNLLNHDAQVDAPGFYSEKPEEFYDEYAPGVTEVLQRCAAGPYTYSSNPKLAALCGTIPRDALDKIDCRRVKRLKYTSPAFGSCDYRTSEYRVTGSPQRKYPVLTDAINLR